MKYEQFVTGFKAPAKDVRCGADAAKDVVQGDVVVAGTVLAATKELCRIELNGAEYEIAASDIREIKVLSPTEPPTPPKAKEKATTPADAAPASPRPQIVMITVKRDTVICQRFPAALLAAMGTWVTVVPGCEASV